MDKIAVVSDIHGNIVALKEVLKDIKKRKIKKIICLGDIVLKGSSPCECLDLIKKECEVVILGNCDYYAVNPDKYDNYDEYNNRLWYRNKLGKNRLDYIKNLPLYKDLYVSGSLISFFHASKNDLFYRVFPTSSKEAKLKLFDNNTNVVVYADIHEQYLDKLGNKTLINTGSVGNSINLSATGNEDDYNETTQAHYLIIEGKINSKERAPISFQFIRIPYNIEEELILARNNCIPDYDKYELELKKGKYRKEINI